MMEKLEDILKKDPIIGTAKANDIKNSPANIDDYYSLQAVTHMPIGKTNDYFEKLEKVIDSLNRKARVQFREAFAEIKDYFADFVEELFGGGRGKMELTADPILEAGVKIEVQPPGEKIKTMSALSGGEKSLASIAFLFALFEYSPTPFCFLDEVDAPLDPDNVSQMINLLHRYSTETQFVIITHNKITMQAASQLFGITMEESGVSTVVGLDLPEAEEWREEAVS